MAPVPEPRVEPLCEVYQSQEDHAGLARTGRHAGPEPHARGQRRPAGADPRGGLPGAGRGRPSIGRDPLADLTRFDEDLLLADMEIVSGRIERLRESVKKPRPNREQEQAELAALEPACWRRWKPASRWPPRP